LDLLQDNLAKIGIEVTAAGMTWTEFLYRLYEVGGYHRDMLQLYWYNWVPEYNDPSVYINNLFTNRTVAYNGAQVNDSLVQQWMEEALEEVDQAKRERIYDNISKRLVEEVYPCAWATVEKLYYAHHINLTGFQPNVLSRHYFYPCQWDPWYISPNPRIDTDATFIVGVAHGPYEIDPHNTRDPISYQTIDQVCEGLYGYNYSDPEMAIIPYLATGDGIWSPDGLNYTIPLRSGVTFHDGTSFNASAVKFTFDRLAYLMDNDMATVEDLYNFRDGTPIINRTEVIDTYTIKFILNAPYAPLQALLCFSGSYILSPTSTPATTIIDTETGDLVGTGPFVYDDYIPDVEVNFHAYDDYWQGIADIELMKFKIYENPNERMTALLTGDVDFIDDLLPEWVDIFRSLTNITVLDEGKTNNYISFLGINNNQINASFREAISYAIDYDFIVNDIREGQVERLKSPIPEGIRYANSTFNYPVLNLPQARLIMQSMGYGVGFDIYDDTEWENTAVTSPFATFNYTYNFGHTIREDILDLLQDNLAKIGIEVTAAGMTWTEFVYRLYEIGGYHRDMLQLYWLPWTIDFNDPSNIFDPLFLNTSSNNFGQVNDEEVSKWIQDALIETDPIQREKIYDNISKRLVEEVYPCAWGTVEKLYTAYQKDLTGFQQNTLERLYLYLCKWDRKLPGTFALGSPDAGTPDDDGNFNLAWAASDEAIDYTVYQHSAYITVINGNLTLLADGITDLNLPLTGYSDGTYYFIIVAHNPYGDTLSNCLQVDVLISNSLTITIPDSSSSWETGTSQYINWGSTGTISNVKIELYKDDLLVMEIISSTPNDGEYYWTIPSALESSTDYQIKISEASDPSVYDFSDYFEIFRPITITIPDSSSSWETGTSQYINWGSTGTISDVKIELYKDDLLVMEIVSSTPNDGEYYWAIPSALESSTHYQIKISEASDPSAYDFSDYFEIYTSTITITVPDSSSSWETGTSQYIKWTSIGPISNVKIELYKDDQLVMEITSDTSNDGEYLWTIVSLLDDSTQYQIKISDVSNPSLYDLSDYFEIKAPVSGTIPAVSGGAIIGVAGAGVFWLIRRKRKS
ncbi:MAG: ABC transporter substrate-binding protein, partial [Promethearchaeota archaeon]